MSGDADTDAAEPWVLRNGRLIIVVGGAVTLIVSLLAVFIFPRWPWAVGPGPFKSDSDLQSARADIRSSGLTLAGGIGVTTAGLLAWGRIELSRREHHLAERSERNDRFGSAVELLGNIDASVRLGGIYALEGLSRDGYDRQTVYDIICAYARNHPPIDRLTDPKHAHDGDLPSIVPAIENRTADYEASLTIAARAPGNVKLDLSGTLVSNHRFQTLTSCNFEGATLTDCNFEGATARSKWTKRNGFSGVVV